MQNKDVLIVGAGFAGLTAARELESQGYSVTILEGRSRIAGRTWLEEGLGKQLELGGTWVHWIQPHVWAELTRYGIDVAEGEPFKTAYWNFRGERRSAYADKILELIDRPNQLLLEESREVFPLPYSPLHSPKALTLDTVNVSEKIDSLAVSEEEKFLLRSFWALNFHGSLNQAAYTQALRWAAISNGDWKLMFEACASFKIKGGTQALADAMASDIRTDIVFNAKVSNISQTEGSVEVLLESGEKYKASALIVTAPLCTLKDITFTPELPEGVKKASSRGQVGMGAKAWIRIKGTWDRFVAFTSEDAPLNFVQAEYIEDDSTILVAFGPDAQGLDVNNKKEVQKALDLLLEGAEVIERLVFAGSDYAQGWGGFIDGAIESGFTAAGLTNKLLSEK